VLLLLLLQLLLLLLLPHRCHLLVAGSMHKLTNS
jgi:hypothetical protein